ncbi:hypothetical protein MICAD_280020 [Microcystis aeruginosa PCC 7941]|nr:hypothetical protein MICAD_280020 [Microcystis aeruginosa PCC 7941]
MIKGGLLDYDIFHDHLFLYDIMLSKINSIDLGLNYDNYTHRTRSRTNFN